VGLAVSDAVASRVGADRAAGDRHFAADAAALLGVRSPHRWADGEMLFWRRWAPLVAVLPGIDRWSARDRASLAAAIRAKESAREADAVPMLTAHAPLRRALRRVMTGSAGPGRPRG